MSENRFIIIKSENYYALVDKERDDIGEIILLSLHKEEQLDEVCDLLNEQQERIKELEEENATLSNLFHACIRGQKRIIQENKKEE